MVSPISSPGAAEAMLQAQRTSARLGEQLTNFQRKLATVSEDANAGSSTAKIQAAQIGGRISGIRQQLSAVRESPGIQDTKGSPPSVIQPTYSSHGLLKTGVLGATLNVKA